MGRRKLSIDDKINELQKIENMIDKFINPKSEKDKFEFIRYIRTIRSKTLRHLITLKLAQFEHFNIFLEHPKIIARNLKISERKVYDLFKTYYIISAIGDLSFSRLFEKEVGGSIESLDGN